ncbi:MAG: hypothetical protein II189_07500, partial [Lachnospiraceae bacterium]|nr:hypothetical protein [Lachnospiraceae bacterium]
MNTGPADVVCASAGLFIKGFSFCRGTRFLPPLCREKCRLKTVFLLSKEETNMRDISMERVNTTRQEILDIIRSPLLTH